MAFKRVAKKRDGVRGRTDLGVKANEAGAYTHVSESLGPDGITRRKVTNVYRLRRITDGQCIDKIDDGSAAGGAMMAGRHALVKLLQKTVVVDDGQGEVELPFVFVDKPLPQALARVGSVRVPVANDQIMAAMADMCGERNERIKRVRAEYEAQRVAEVAEESRRKEAAKKAVKKVAASAQGVAQ